VGVKDSKVEGMRQKNWRKGKVGKRLTKHAVRVNHRTVELWGIATVVMLPVNRVGQLLSFHFADSRRAPRHVWYPESQPDAASTSADVNAAASTSADANAAASTSAGVNAAASTDAGAHATSEQSPPTGAPAGGGKRSLLQRFRGVFRKSKLK